MVAVPGVQAPVLSTLYLSIPYFRRYYTLDPFRASKESSHLQICTFSDKLLKKPFDNWLDLI